MRVTHISTLWIFAPDLGVLRFDLEISNDKQLSRLLVLAQSRVTAKKDQNFPAFETCNYTTIVNHHENV